MFDKILPKNITKVCFKQYQNLFQDIPGYPINKQKNARKKPKAITVLKKEGGGGPARYDHAHRFNGFFFTPSLKYYAYWPYLMIISS